MADGFKYVILRLDLNGGPTVIGTKNGNQFTSKNSAYDEINRIKSAIRAKGSPVLYSFRVMTVLSSEERTVRGG